MNNEETGQGDGNDYVRSLEEKVKKLKKEKEEYLRNEILRPGDNTCEMDTEDPGPNADPSINTANNSGSLAGPKRSSKQLLHAEPRMQTLGPSSNGSLLIDKANNSGSSAVPKRSSKKLNGNQGSNKRAGRWVQSRKLYAKANRSRQFAKFLVDLFDQSTSTFHRQGKGHGRGPGRGRGHQSQRRR
ncbi:uncharacterized protein LOC122504135 [Leptopilina heterotoma]|uniref:uncharacterized protein LOC122504135 n=1 Tax=Leptopilina heterotoma TaxID=63436 RepID=UPI001CA8DB87|nr:uncharacterized protein LOC122504135 [Leptopilina heterotoma]